MPGKTPASRGGKEPSSTATSTSSGELGVKRYNIWPKWTDDDIIADKRDAGNASKPSAGENTRLRKGTTLSTGHVGGDTSSEDDVLPPSLSGGDVVWVSPGMYIKAPGTPVIVEEPVPSEIDLISENSHLMHSELMCSIIDQLQALWNLRASPFLAVEGPDSSTREWRPWDLIQHKKEHPVPMFNPLGKYGVKIFWMGSWRKITVTDQLPLRRQLPSDRPDRPQNKEDTSTAADGVGVGEGEEEGEGETRVVLLPRTSNTAELWPVIVTKAILKVAALDYKGGDDWSECGDCSVIHMLTGWCPQNLSTRLESDVLWRTLCHSLPLWKRPCNNGEEGDRGEEEGGETRSNRESERNEGERDDESGSDRGRIVIAQFTSAYNGKPLTKAKEALMNESHALLKEYKLIPRQFDPQTHHSRRMLIRQVRNIPLQPPPKIKPPIPAPEEHAWLGYSLRKHEPWKGPPPKPHPPRWVEVLTPFPVTSDNLSGSETEVEEDEQETDLPDNAVTRAVRETDADRKGSRTSTEGGGQSAGIWMKYEDFRKAFSCLEVFTSPAEFQYCHSYKDLTATVENVSPQEETKGKGRLSHSPANKVAKCTETAVADDTNILFIEARDDPAEEKETTTELHVVFTCFSNWREGSKNLKTERKKSVALKQRRVSILSHPLKQLQYSVPNKTYLKNSTYTFAGGLPPSIAKADKGGLPPSIPEVDEENSTAGSTEALVPPATPSPPAASQGDEEGDERIMAGSLVVEEYDWRSIETKLPLLRLTTTGVKGALMKIDRNKRMFKMHVKAPLGYHLSIVSNINFELVNEDSAYNRMHKEKLGFSKVLTGAIPPLQPNSWGIVFREVLLVRRIDQLLAFFLDCPVAGHLLRVVDNDDGREMPRMARITEPQLYSPNKSGYTVLCEMWTRSEPVNEGTNWKLRVISSGSELPLCEGWEREEEEEEEEEDERDDGKNRDVGELGEKGMEVRIATEFHHKEIRDYCLPDRDSVIFRYALKVTQDCPVTVQLQTSKKDAHIKLEIFDGETLLAMTQGRAYCFIAMCHLRHSVSTTPTELSPSLDETQPTTAVQRYVLVATILHDSWPLADTAWSCIADIKAAEEEKASTAASGGGGGGGGKGKKPPSASSKAGKGKKSKTGGKEGGGGGSGDGIQSSASLSNVDSSKPHWILRVALRQSDKEYFEMCKDTEKEDELKSMQAAWETQQPGRLEKGQKARKRFLEAHALKDFQNNTEDLLTVPSTASVGSSVHLSTTPSPLQPPHGPIPLQRIDLSLYTENNDSTPRVLTAEERERRDEERRETIRRYRAWRRSILQSRDQDRQFRNEEKLRQLKEAEKQQSEVEATRKRMNCGRETIRQRSLAEEKARREAEQAALRATEDEATASARDSKAKGKKGKKK